MGISEAVAGQVSSTGTGGTAEAEIDLVGSGDVDATAKAVAGGSPVGPTGGAATLGRVHGASTGGGDVRVTGWIVAGSGLAQGVNGADAILVNAIDGVTSGHLTLVQIAEGGLPASGAPARPWAALAV